MQTQLSKTEFLSKLKTDYEFNKEYGRNPTTKGSVALPCCHYGFQCYTTVLTLDERIRIAAAREGQEYEQYKTNWNTDEQWVDDLDSDNIPKRKLSLKFNIRSVDCFLGMPFDIASYSILVHMLCMELNYVPNELIVASGDTHIYLNHLEQVKTQMSREPRALLPVLRLKGHIGKSVFDYTYDDFEVADYDSHAVIKAPIAV